MLQENIEVMSEPVTPLVTVGVATYNNPEGLKGALNCIVNQTYTNLEIIVSDDCSPDLETRRIISEFARKDKRIRAIRQERNLGAPANIHFVLTQATGDYFMWADDDDLRDVRWVEALLRKLSNKDVIGSLGKIVVIDEFGNSLRTCEPMQFSGPRIVRLVNYYLSEESSGKACIACGLFRTAFLRKIKHWADYEINKFGFGDYCFSFDCLQYGNVLTDQSVTIYKRLSRGNKDSERNTRSADMLSNMFTRLRYFANYSRIASNLFDKMAIILLFPIKCIKSFAFYALRRFRH